MTSVSLVLCWAPSSPFTPVLTTSGSAVEGIVGRGRDVSASGFGGVIGGTVGGTTSQTGCRLDTEASASVSSKPDAPSEEHVEMRQRGQGLLSGPDSSL